MPPKLSSELWLDIMHLCDRTTLLQLNLISKDLHDLCLPLLYRDIDLSIHNSGISYFPEIFTPGYYIEALHKASWETEAPLRRAQESFLETLLNHQEYAPFIRNFTWTLIFGPEGCDHNFGVEEIPYPHNYTWQVLLSLQNVRRVDLASEHYLPHNKYIMNCPNFLFPIAESIRLSRLMDQKLIKSIISHHPERLKELSIDNVQHWGYYSDGDGIALNTYIEGAQQQIEADPPLFQPGPIYNIFDGLTRYLNLRCLYLRKAAQMNQRERGWCTEADITVYKEWALFIISVKPQLRRLTYEQSHSWFTPERMSGPNRFGRQNRRPMDQRFHDYLLPVFLESGWDNLERLEIIGVGRWKDEDPIVLNETTKGAIRDALGPYPELIVQEEPSQTAEIWSPL